MDRLTEKLQQFGLTDLEARTYLSLLEHGPTTALSLSRNLAVPRTNLYRALSTLTTHRLVRQDRDKASVIRAASHRELERLLRTRQEELDDMKVNLPSLFGELANLAASKQVTAETTYYDGADGLRQITLNSLEADEIRIYEKSDMAAFLDREEAERIRRVMVNRKISTRQLTNATKLSAWTDVSGVTGKRWEPRHIDPAVLAIDFEILIYNDVVGIYDFGRRDTFGIEVRSRPLAHMQKQLFDLTWNLAQPMVKSGKRGSAGLA